MILYQHSIFIDLSLNLWVVIRTKRWKARREAEAARAAVKRLNFWNSCHIKPSLSTRQKRCVVDRVVVREISQKTYGKLVENSQKFQVIKGIARPCVSAVWKYWAKKRQSRSGNPLVKRFNVRYHIRHHILIPIRLKLKMTCTCQTDTLIESHLVQPSFHTEKIEKRRVCRIFQSDERHQKRSRAL